MSEPFADSTAVFENPDVASNKSQRIDGSGVQNGEPSWSRFDFRSILAVTIGVAAVLGIGKQNLEMGVVLGCILAFAWGALAIVGPVVSNRNRMWLIVVSMGVAATLLSFFAQTLVYGLHMRVSWVFAAVLTLCFGLVLLCFYSTRFRRALAWTGLAFGLVVLPIMLTVSYFNTSGDRWAERNIYYVGREHLFPLPASYGLDTRGLERDNVMLTWLGETRTLLGLSRCVSVYLNEIPKPEDFARFRELKYCKSVTIHQIPVDAALLRAIAAMPALENLGIYETPEIADLLPLENAERLKTIQIGDTDLKSVNGLGKLNALESFFTNDAGTPTDVASEIIHCPNLIDVRAFGPVSREDLVALMEEKKQRVASGDLRTLSSLQLGATEADVETVHEFLKVVMPRHPMAPTLQLTQEQKQEIANLNAEDWEKASTVEATQGK